MAVTANPVHAASLEPVGTFTMSLGGSEWKPRGLPHIGDLVAFIVLKPAAVDYVTDSSGGMWTAAGEDGRTWWCVVGPKVPTSVTFHARDAGEWEIRGWVLAAGTYELPGST